MTVVMEDRYWNVVRTSQDLFVAIWKRFAENFETAEVEQREWHDILWADTPLPFWNSLAVSGEVSTLEQLKASVEKLSLFARGKTNPGFISVCLSLLDDVAAGQAGPLCEREGYSSVISLTGMICENFPLQLALPAEIRIERAYDFNNAIDLNSLAYSLPVDVGRASMLTDDFAKNSFVYVGYEDDDPVATATVIVEGDVLYLALVATKESARGRGLGEAVVRHSLQAASEATRINKAALHATDMGKPVYERLGFTSVGNFAWYLRAHD